MSIRDEIRTAIQLCGGATFAELKDDLKDLNSKQISNALHQLKDAGEIERIENRYFVVGAEKPPAVKLPPAPVSVKQKPATAIEDPEQHLHPALTGDVGDETEHVGEGPDVPPSVIEAYQMLESDTPAAGADQQPAPGSREHLARQVRGAMGEFNDDDQPVVACVEGLVASNAEMRGSVTQMLRLLADIRAAAGDPEGKLMQPELIAHIQQMHQDAADAAQVRKYLAGFGTERPLLDTVQSIIANQSQPTSPARAIETLQEHLNDVWDTAEITITPDGAYINTMGRNFALPTVHAELEQFLSALSFVTGQWIENGAA